MQKIFAWLACLFFFLSCTPIWAEKPGDSSPTPAPADVDFGSYMANLQRSIKKHWFPPKGHEMDRVVVAFKVHKMGELSNLKLHKGSGVEISDKAALKAVEDAAPFAPLPAGSLENVDVQFTFDYSVFFPGKTH